MLVLENLSRRFQTKTAVNAVSLSIERGSFVGIIGRSGAGKSTLLRMINRLIDPSEGTISYSGERVTTLRGRALRDWRARCAMIFQQFNLVGRLDVITNVVLGRLNKRSTFRSLIRNFSDDEWGRAIAALERLGIAEVALQRAGTLSGGQQQRVAIARAMLQQPDIILADEPIASLDPRNAQIVMEALRDLNRSDGMTVITNLHTLDTARQYCSRIVGMTAGQVVFDGRPDELTEDAARRIYGADGLKRSVLGSHDFHEPQISVDTRRRRGGATHFGARVGPTGSAAK
jgi:phosphonate transport system ATP-binding protein